MAHKSKTMQLVQYLKETDVYQNLVESIKSLDECDPKPAKPMEYIVEKIGYKTISVVEFMALKEDLNRLQDEVSSMRTDLVKLKMQSIDDVQDIENNNMPVDQSTMNGHEQSVGLVFGDICFEKFTNGVETYNVFAKVDNCSLINENSNVFPQHNSDLVAFWPENQNDIIEIVCRRDISALETVLNETSGIRFLEKIPERQAKDENTSATVPFNDINVAKPETSAINVSHSTEISSRVNTESDDQSSQSIADISLDQSKTSANDCSHSTEVEAELNVLARHTNRSPSETFKTHETSNIQILEMIPNEHEADDNTTKSLNASNSYEILEAAHSAEMNEESDEQNSQSITDISNDQSKASAIDCSHSHDLETEKNISSGECVESDFTDEIDTTIGLWDIQILEMIPEESETDENMSAYSSSNDVILTETGLLDPQSMALHSNQAAASVNLNISGQLKDESHKTPNESIETQENSIDTESDVKNNASETTENIEKLIRECFIKNCNEMQAAKLPPSDSEDSEVRISNITQSEMVTYNIYQHLPNDKVREMTGLNISDSAECFEINTTQTAFIMEGAEISDHEIEAVDSQIKMNTESGNPDSSQSSASSSSSDLKTVVECNGQNEQNKDCPNGIPNYGEKVPDGIKEVKARRFVHDDMETEFLLSVSSAGQSSIRTFPSK